MIIYIAEKSSIAKKLAENLPGNKEVNRTYIKVGQDIITWLAGHVLRLKEPQEIDEKYKKWNLEDLPIIPEKENWKPVVIESKTNLYKNVKEIIINNNPEYIVNFGDADREGQLLIDEFLESINNTVPVKRLWLPDSSKKGFERALKDMKSNEEPIYRGMKKSAETRSKIDWLMGMNYSRFFTIAAQQKGWEGSFPVGRVKTPTIALIVRREEAIKNFKKEKYYIINGFFATANNNSIIGQWHPSETSEADPAGNSSKLTDIIKVRDILAKLTSKTEGVVTNFEKQEKEENQKGLYSLSKLQVEAGKKYHYDPNIVLEIAQALYEKNFTTYPRTDCEYLPEAQFVDNEIILHNLRLTGDEELNILAEAADVKIKSAAWNDKKITAHYAIIPTTEICNMDLLNEKEKNIFKMIAKSYITQFFPKYKYFETKIEILIKDEKFISKGRKTIEKGWKRLYQSNNENNTGEKEDEEQELPLVNIGEKIILLKAIQTEKTTKPLKRFTTGSLITAMKNVTPYVKDEKYKKILQDTKGIGTEATRGSIIEEILKTGFILKDGYDLKPSEKAELIIKYLPEDITYPDLTGLLELKLDTLQIGKIQEDEILTSTIDEIQKICSSKIEMEVKEQIKCPKCEDGFLRKIKGKNGYFWSCSNWKNGCATTFNDNKGKPVLEDSTDKIECPQCHKGYLIQRSKKDNPKEKFWGCSDWKNGCKAFFPNYKNKPVIIKCPKCKEGFLKKIKGKNGDFWSCENYPKCKSSFKDKNGKPII